MRRACLWTLLFSSPAFLATPPAQANDHDRSAPLYSTQIRFDADNEPMITVGIMDRQARITLSVDGDLKVLPEGPGGTELITRSERRWTVKLESSVPAVRIWRVVLARLPSDDLTAIQTVRRRWKDRGIATATTELGSTFGFFGKVMDTRSISILTESHFDTRQAALKAAAAFRTEHGIDTGVIPVLKERPHARLVLTDGKTRVRATDVLWLQPTGQQRSITVHDVEFGRGFSWHGREDRDYRGTLYVTVDPHGKLAVGNMVPAETMLRGIVPAEIYASAPPPALQAQAVAARAELLAKIGRRHLADPWLLCADVHCQVYAGNRKEDDRTDRAIKATRGRMLFADGDLVDTVYSSNCGGHTEHNENSWSHMHPNQTLRGRVDGDHPLGEPTEQNVHAFVNSKPPAFCNNRYSKHTYRWTKRVAVDTMRKGLRAQNKDVGVPRRIEVLKRGVSGRILRVRVYGTLNRQTVVDGELNIRKAFGGLRSSLFVHETLNGADGHPTNFVFTGAGFGHGVGMCQMGAIGRANAGHSVEQILQHYYPNATLERIY